MRNLSIESLVHINPKNIVTSLELEKMMSNTMERLNIPYGSIEKITGVSERRWPNKEDSISDLSAEIGKKAIEKINLDPKKIGCLISCSVVKDYSLEPTVALVTHDKIGLSESCMNFDVGCTCAGMSAGLDIASALIHDNQVEYALVLAGESSRYLQEETTKRLNKENATKDDFYTALASLTTGSGASAMIVCKEENSTTGHIINKSIFMADTRHHPLSFGYVDHFYVDGKTLLREALYIDSTIWGRAQEELNWKNDACDIYIPHQVSTPNNESFFRIPNVNTDKSKHKFIYNKFGNQGPPSWPITLSMTAEEINLTGNRIGILSIGAAFNAYLIDIKW